MDILNFENLKEHKLHGDTMLPAALYTVTHNNMGRILPHHWHSELEFIYIEVGKAIFTIDNEDILVNAGECIFVNSGHIHSGVSKTQVCSYSSVVFSTNFLSNIFDACHEFFDGIITNKFIIFQHYKCENPLQESVISELKYIIKELENKDMAYALSIKSKLLWIFTMIFRNSLYTIKLDTHKDLLSTKKQNSLKLILSYIFQNYNKKLKLIEISEHLNLSPQYLCKFFKELTGTNIVEYINHYRIDKASSLLKISSLSITDISLECGFENLSYFNRVFKKQLGCTPTGYRLNFQGEVIIPSH